MLSCDDVLERLSPHLDGQLLSAEADGVDTHLSSCTRCEATWVDLRAAVAIAAEAPRLELDPALISRTIAAANARPPVQSPAPFLMTLAVAAAVVLAVLLRLDWSPPAVPAGPELARAPAPTLDDVRTIAVLHLAEAEIARATSQERATQRAVLAYASSLRTQARLEPSERLLSARAAAQLGDSEQAALSYLNLVEVPAYREKALAGLRAELAKMGTSTVEGLPTANLSSAALCTALLDEATIEVVKGRYALILLRRSSAGDLKSLKRLGTVRISGRAVAVKADERKLRKLLKRSAPMRRMLERRARR